MKIIIKNCHSHHHHHCHHHHNGAWKSSCFGLIMATMMILSRRSSAAFLRPLGVFQRSAAASASSATNRLLGGDDGIYSSSHSSYHTTTAASYNKYSTTTTQRFYSSTTEDRSAMSQSRPPFKMPNNSPDDSKPQASEDSISWNDLGVWPDVSQYLQTELNLQSPTTVQSMVIPKLLQQQQQYGAAGDDNNNNSNNDQEQQHLAFLAATGSGKTIAYVLPLLQQLKRQEQEVLNPEETLRRPQRPRVIILAPTRELVQQITTVVKSLSHCLKVSSHALMGGSSGGGSGGSMTGSTKKKGTNNKSLSRQSKLLQQRPMDVIVATPGRLLQHWKQKNSIFLGNVQTIVLDEMDTMLEQGFQKDLEQILTPLMMNHPGSSSSNGAGTEGTTTIMKRKKEEDDNWGSGDTSTPKKSSSSITKSTPRIILTSATMTQSIQKLLGDSPKTSNLQFGAKRSYLNQKQKEEQQTLLQLQQEAASSTAAGNNKKKGAKATSSSSNTFQFPHMTIITAPGLHKAVPRLKQTFVDVGSTDKMSLLIDVLSSNARGTRNDGAATIVFCNTVASVRAVQYALSEARMDSLAYHAELNSGARTENLQRFRKAMEGRSSTIQMKKTKDDDDDDGIEDIDIDINDDKYPINILVCTDLAARGLDMPNIDHVVMFDFPLNSLDYLHRCGRTARGKDGTGAVTALVSKRDKVLALAIERAVRRGEPLDGLSSRKSDYGAGRMGGNNNNSSSGGGGSRNRNTNGKPQRGGGGGGGRSNSPGSNNGRSGSPGRRRRS